MNDLRKLAEKMARLSDEWRICTMLTHPPGTQVMDKERCPHLTSSGTCQCRPKCRMCGWGEHMAVHMPAYDFSGNKVRDHYDHAFSPKWAAHTEHKLWR